MSDSTCLHWISLDINNIGFLSLLSPIDAWVGLFSFMSCEVLVDR